MKRFISVLIALTLIFTILTSTVAIAQTNTKIELKKAIEIAKSSFVLFKLK